MSITFNIQDFGDNNSLQVPSLSPVDGRFMGKDMLRPISLSVSDKDMESSKFRSDIRKERSILHRPVSDQRLHEPIKKEVSWHSKIPTSVQTLSCVEDSVQPQEIAQLENEEKHTQSQPILGTLESSSRNKHVCRHTYSVRQSYTNSKDNSKRWALRRSSSTGEERSRLKDKYIPLSLKTVNVTASTTTTTDSNCSSISSALCDSKLDVLDTSRDDAFSLIDWEEDEKACDEEVQNIIGENGEEEDDEEKPTPSLPLETSIHFEQTTPLPAFIDKSNSTNSLTKASPDPEQINTAHSKDTHDNTETVNLVEVGESYADSDYKIERACDESKVDIHDETNSNIPLNHLSVPSSRFVNDGNLLAVPSAAHDSNDRPTIQFERRKEESHL